MDEQNEAEILNLSFLFSCKKSERKRGREWKNEITDQKKKKKHSEKMQASFAARCISFS